MVELQFSKLDVAGSSPVRRLHKHGGSMDAKKYTIRTSWSDEDEAFIATCPEFPGLSAFGDTRAKATKEAEIVLEEFIKITLEDGETLPTPSKNS